MKMFLFIKIIIIIVLIITIKKRVIVKLGFFKNNMSTDKNANSKTFNNKILTILQNSLLKRTLLIVVLIVFFIN